MIESIRQLFAINNVIILFVYGQVFFVLGLAITLQSLRHSRLSLARSLKWLAAFGFTHGLHEWGDVFIPIQAQYLPVSVTGVLQSLQLLLLALSFTCLFQYGIETLRPLPGRWRYLRYAPLSIFVTWLLYMFTPGLTGTHSLAEWHRLGNILARYSLGFPGGLLAAYSLRHQAQRIVVPFKMEHTISMLRLAGFALAGYGIMGGLIVPAGSFFPANVINQERLQALTLLPIQAYRSILGLILTYATIRVMEVFQVELDRHITNMEEAQILLAERERIGRELHDGTLQTIYAAGLLFRTAERSVNQGQGEKGIQHIQQGVALLNRAVSDIRNYISDLRPQPTGQSLVAGLTEIATAFHIESLVQLELALDLPPDITLSPAQVGHLLAITNEAMSNIARHATATKVVMRAEVKDGLLLFEIEDNGRGFPSDLVLGYGLNNMRERTQLLGGVIHLYSRPHEGTRLHIEIPMENNHETNTNLIGR
ncbi:MAG: sensor histidine kinase [Chloroflexi bacterium]|nr:sensor histidine kinase [Chloroflexota bacterium]